MGSCTAFMSRKEPNLLATFISRNRKKRLGLGERSSIHAFETLRGDAPKRFLALDLELPMLKFVVPRNRAISDIPGTTVPSVNFRIVASSVFSGSGVECNAVVIPRSENLRHFPKIYVCVNVRMYASWKRQTNQLREHMTRNCEQSAASTVDAEASH